MKRKLIGALVACGSLCATAAMAADLPYLSSVSAYNWTGFYFGATAGGTFTTENNIFLDPIAALPGVNPISIGSTNNNTEFTGGLEAGYNLQFNSFVVGLEGDFYYAGSHQVLDGTYATGLALDPTVTVSGANSNHIYGTFRARLGYAFNRALFYVTAGGVFGGNSAPTTLVFNPVSGPPPCPTCTFIASGNNNNRMGAVFGGGVEYAFASDWTVKVEYLHTLYGMKKVSFTNNFNPGYPPPYSGVQTFTLNGRGLDTNIIRVGANYRF